MFRQLRLGAVGVIAAFALVPAAGAGTYPEPTGDAGMGDLSVVTVAGDKANGQVVFRITGSELAASELSDVWLEIDSDSNPLTGDLTYTGTDYFFDLSPHERSFSFDRWNGSEWVTAPDSTVRISGDSTQITVSVNRSELGNSSAFNFRLRSVSIKTAGAVTFIGFDYAPDEGMYNYSFDANGPRIDSVDVQTKPSVGPKAGKKLVVTPTGLHLPADGREKPVLPKPDSYACTATLGSRKLVGTGTGSCTFAIPKQKVKRKRLTVQLTVNYEGATKTVPLSFRVG